MSRKRITWTERAECHADIDIPDDVDDVETWLEDHAMEHGWPDGVQDAVHERWVLDVSDAPDVEPQSIDANRARLEELRIELRAERISYGELMELQNLVAFIDPGDVELLEAAGVPEHDD